MRPAKHLKIKPWPMLRGEALSSETSWVSAMVALCTAGAALILFTQVLHG